MSERDQDQGESASLSTACSLYGVFGAPFTYCEASQAVRDCGGNRVCDIRGWGYLTGKGEGGLALSGEVAMRIQDEVGREIAKAINLRANAEFSHPRDED